MKHQNQSRSECNNSTESKQRPKLSQKSIDQITNEFNIFHAYLNLSYPELAKQCHFVISPNTTKACMVMPKLGNTSLIYFINDYCNFLSRGDRYELGMKVVEQVVIFHKTGNVHRDIKPDNFRMSYFPRQQPGKRFEVFLIDCGFSKQNGVQSKFQGSPMYLPPKFAYSSLFTVAIDDDLYALGYVLNHIFCYQDGTLDNNPFKFREEAKKSARAKFIEILTSIAKHLNKDTETYDKSQTNESLFMYFYQELNFFIANIKKKISDISELTYRITLVLHIKSQIKDFIVDNKDSDLTVYEVLQGVSDILFDSKNENLLAYFSAMAQTAINLEGLNHSSINYQDDEKKGLRKVLETLGHLSDTKFSSATDVFDQISSLHKRFTHEEELTSLQSWNPGCFKPESQQPADNMSVTINARHGMIFPNRSI